MDRLEQLKKAKEEMHRRMMAETIVAGDGNRYAANCAYYEYAFLHGKLVDEIHRLEQEVVCPETH